VSKTIMLKMLHVMTTYESDDYNQPTPMNEMNIITIQEVVGQAYRATILVPCLRLNHYEGPIRASCRLMYKNGYRSVASANLVYVFEIENFTNTAVTIPAGAVLKNMLLKPGVKMTKMVMTIENLAALQHDNADDAVYPEDYEDEGLASPTPPFSPSVSAAINSTVDSTTTAAAAAAAATTAAAAAAAATAATAAATTAADATAGNAHGC
jgi:hypothetical protein